MEKKQHQYYKLTMEPGTYWSDRLDRYVERGDPEWSNEEYKSVTGEDWVDAR